MSREHLEHSISRRAALLGAGALAATASRPAIAQAEASGAGVDAPLIAMVEEWEHVQESQITVGKEEYLRWLALVPKPPDLLDYYAPPPLGDLAGWCTRTRRDMDTFCRGVLRTEPASREVIERNHDRHVADLDAYAADCEKLYQGPEFTALRERRRQLMDRDLELLEEIAATPARSPAGALRKMRAADGWELFTARAADHPSQVAPKLFASVLRDLERLAGQA